MSGDLAGAREAWERAHVVALDLGLFDLIAFVAQDGCLVEMLAGDPEAAERIAREAYEVLHPAGNLLWTIANDQLAQ